MLVLANGLLVFGGCHAEALGKEGVESACRGEAALGGYGVDGVVGMLFEHSHGIVEPQVVDEFAVGGVGVDAEEFGELVFWHLGLFEQHLAREVTVQIEPLVDDGLAQPLE